MKLKCNHCKHEVKHSASIAHEVGFYEFDNKWYCDNCIYRFTRFYAVESHL